MIFNLFQRLFGNLQKDTLDINTDVLLDNIHCLDKDKLLNRNLPKIFCSNNAFISSLEQDMNHYYSSSKIINGNLSSKKVSLSKLTQGLIVFSSNKKFLKDIENKSHFKKISENNIHIIDPGVFDSIKINLFDAPTAEIKRRCSVLFLSNIKFKTQSLLDSRINSIILSHFIDLAVLNARLNHKVPSINDLRKLLQDHSTLVQAYKMVKNDFESKTSYSDMFDYSLWILGKKGFDSESPVFLQNTYDHVSNVLFWFDRFIAEYNIEKRHPGVSTSLVEHSINLANNIQRTLAIKEVNNLFGYSKDSISFSKIVSNLSNTGIWLINYSCSNSERTKLIADLLLTSLLRDRYGYEDKGKNELSSLPLYCDQWSKYISREQIYWLELLSVEKNNLYFSGLDKEKDNFRNYKLGSLFYFLD